MVDILDIRDKLDKIDVRKIVAKLLKEESAENAKPHLKSFLAYKELATKYLEAVARDYDDNYLYYGGFGLSANLSRVEAHSKYHMMTGALGYARAFRDMSDEGDKFDWKLYNKMLKEGLKLERYELDFLKSLKDSQLFDLLTTGEYKLN